jgi:Rha family phage regulatory protein
MKKLTLIKNESDYGVTALDGVPVVSSRKVAEIFDKRHDNVLHAISNCGCSKEFNLLNFKETYYKDSQGRKYREYLMTKDGFAFIVMGFTGKKAAQFKEAYINRFNEMERFIRSRNLARLEYPELTDAIKMMHDEPKFFHYSNEADIINRIVLGMSAKQFREEHGIDKGDSIRGHLTSWQAEAIQRLQKVDVGLVVIMPDFKQRKKALQTYFEAMKDTIQARIGSQGIKLISSGN